MTSQDTTRRALFAGIAAMPALALAGTAVSAPGSDEQQLIALEGEIKGLRARMREIRDEDDAALTELVRREDALLDKAAGIRATTIGGLQCKALMSRTCEHGIANKPLADSLVADLLAWPVSV